MVDLKDCESDDGDITHLIEMVTKNLQLDDSDAETQGTDQSQ